MKKSTAGRGKKSVLKRLLLICLGLAVMVVVVVDFFLEPLVERKVRAILKQNIPLRVEFRDIDIRLATRSLSVQGLQVYGDRDEPDIEIERVKAYPAILPLLQRKIVLRALQVVSPGVTVYQKEGRANIEEIISVLQKNKTTKTGEKIPLDLLIQRLTIGRGRIFYYPEISDIKRFYELSPLNVTVQEVDIGNTSAVSEFSGAVGIFGFSPAIEFSGTGKFFAEPVSGEGGIRIRDMELSDFQKLLPSTLSIKRGILNGNIDFSFRLEDAGIEDVKVQPDETKTVAAKGPSEKKGKEASKTSAQVFTIPRFLQVRSVTMTVREMEVVTDEAKGAGIVLEEANIAVGELAYSVKNTELRGSLVLGYPEGEVSWEGLIEVEEGVPHGDIDFKAKNIILASVNPFLSGDFPVEINGGSLKLNASGDVSWEKLDLKVEAICKDLQLERKSGSGAKAVLGIPLPILTKYLTESDGRLAIPFTVRGSVRKPKMNFTKTFAKVVGTVAVDAAITQTIGLPAAVADKVLEKTTGKSVIGTVKKGVKDIFKKGEEESDSKDSPLYEKD